MSATSSRRNSAVMLGREDLPSRASVDAIRGIMNLRSAPHTPLQREDDVALFPRVLVIYTGGTIGMKSGPNGYAPVPDYLQGLLRSLPMFHDPSVPPQDGSLVTPLSVYERHILYDIKEFDPLMDSACMSMGDWAKIALTIEEHYSAYDGFVVLHGTDTLAYTASALSFMLEHLGKTVVMTGAQIPITEHLNDAHHNFLGALTICGHFVIPEVSVYFAGKLYRGNRTTKLDAAHIDAFGSPNMAALAEMGTGINIDWSAIFVPPDPVKCFQVFTAMVPNVAVLHLFPGIHIGTMRAFCRPPIQGIVLQTFGSGNVFDSRSDVLEIISFVARLADDASEAVRQNILVVNCTQCIAGTVTDVDATGRALLSAGALPGYDMTTEAALTKLCYVLGKTGLSNEQQRQMMTMSLRGELTIPDEGARFTLREPTLIQRVASAIMASSRRETEMVGNALFPVMLSAAAAGAHDEDGLQRLSALEAEAIRTSNFPAFDVDVSEFRSLRHMRWFYDASARTPLHVASLCGNAGAVKILLQWNASVHVRDALGHTALYEAVMGRSDEVIGLLRAAGAHLDLSDDALAGELCIAAADNDLELLRLWHHAGASFSVLNSFHRSAFHIALLRENQAVAEFLAPFSLPVIQQPDASGKSAWDWLQRDKSPEWAMRLRDEVRELLDI